MAKMVITMLIMMVLFLGGVLFGVDQASEGITETRGYANSSTPNAVESEMNDDGSYQINVMGQDFQQVDLQEKEEKYQDVQSAHFTQKLASALEGGVKWFYNKVIDTTYKLFQAFF